jgi:hypothetical protein
LSTSYQTDDTMTISISIARCMRRLPRTFEFHRSGDCLMLHHRRCDLSKRSANLRPLRQEEGGIGCKKEGVATHVVRDRRAEGRRISRIIGGLDEQPKQLKAQPRWLCDRRYIRERGDARIHYVPSGPALGRGDEPQEGGFTHVDNSRPSKLGERVSLTRGRREVGPRERLGGLLGGHWAG